MCLRAFANKLTQFSQSCSHPQGLVKELVNLECVCRKILNIGRPNIITVIVLNLEQFLPGLDEVQEELLYYPTGVGVGVCVGVGGGVGVSKMLKFLR